MARPGRRRSPETQVRDAQCLAMRRAGLTYPQIAQQIREQFTREAAITGEKPRGFSAPSAVDAVKRALREYYREEYADAVAIELERLDDLIRQTLRIASARHYVVSEGRVVNGPDGIPLEDYAPKLQAVVVLRGLSESRRKLLGLDAPRRQVIEVITEDAVDRMIAELTKEITENGAHLPKAITAG